MTGRPKIQWHVPSDEWERFLRHVERENGEIKGYVGREVERAMREYADADEWAEIEERVDRLIEAAGRSPAALGKKKSLADPPSAEDTTKVRCRVDARLKEEFAGYAKRHYPEETLGVVLARALRGRRDGGRAGRVERKLDRVQEDAEAVSAEVNPDAEESMSVRERRTVAICSRLGEQFTREELEDAIGDVAGDSRPTLEAYTDRVLDRLTYTSHPHNADLFVAEAEAREIAAETDAPDLDAPAIERKEYRDLTREEKVHGLRVELARRATDNGGRRQVDATTVREEVFDGRPSEGHARTLMRLAGEADGFTYLR